jgi:hypothetical protein
MIIWLVFAGECVIFVGLCYWVGREGARLLRQMKQTMGKIQPVLKAAQELAVEAAPVMQKAQALVVEARELAALTQQTQAQARESLQTLRQITEIKGAFLQIKALAPMLLRQKQPQSRIKSVAQKLLSLARPRRKRNPLRLLLPAGIGAILGSGALLALKRLRSNLIS